MDPLGHLKYNFQVYLLRLTQKIYCEELQQMTSELYKLKVGRCVPLWYKLH